ncbi:WD40-repeat-containing domain protein [Gorgonomyces haynaldii]|nr:WD40-repeat-containing domain protein [Gorgonomyces haynaldii]
MNQCIIATCADAKARVYMWNKETENFVTEPVVLESGTLVKDTVDCLATHYTGLFFATGGRDGCVYLYSMLPDHPMPDCLPKILKIFPAHRGRINDLRFSHRGNRLVSGSKDGRVVVFDIGLETKCLEIKTAEEKRGIVEESEKYLMDPNATASNTRPLEITSVAFNLDDTRIVTASIDHVIRVFDAFTGQAYHELRGHTAKVFMTEAHPKDKRIVLTAGHDGSVFLWDIYKGRSIFTVTQEETILGATFSPEGDQFLVSDFRGIVTVYGLETFEYHVPLEQFFLSDWYTVKEDLMGNLICEDTQLPGHLVEPGEVVTMGRDTYPESIYSRPDYFPYPYELEQSMVRERMGDLKEQLRLDRKLIQHLKQKRSEPKTINKKVLTKRRRQDFVESDEEDAPPPILFLPPEEPMIQIPQESSGDEYGAEENADEGDDASFDEPVFDEFDLQSDQQPEGEEFVQSTTRQQRFEKRSRLRSSSPEGSEEQLNLRKRKISSFAEDYDSDMFDESELLLPEPSERKIVKKRLKLPARTSVQPWIAQDTPQFTPYLPQMHDKVFYIKAGHEEFSQKVDDYKRIVVNPHLPEIVLGEIVSIQYKLNPMLICQIELAMFDGLELPAEYDPQKLQKVKIQWFDWNDVPDFIILYDLYLHGRKQVFEPGDIVMARYENGDVEAKIESVGEQEWAKYTVSFEGFEEQLKFNPWELRRKEDKFPDLPSLDQESSKNLLGIVQGVASEPLFEAFVPEIPYDIFPEYLSMIPYPICIQLILNRLFNGFYRSLFVIWLTIAVDLGLGHHVSKLH